MIYSRVYVCVTSFTDESLARRRNQSLHRRLHPLLPLFPPRSPRLLCQLRNWTTLRKLKFLLLKTSRSSRNSKAGKSQQRPKHRPGTMSLKHRRLCQSRKTVGSRLQLICNQKLQRRRRLLACPSQSLSRPRSLSLFTNRFNRNPYRALRYLHRRNLQHL